MPRYRLTIAYDGTDFNGWQKQEPYAPSDDDPRPPDQRPTRPGEPTLAVAQPLEIREGETRPRIALRTVQHVVEQAVRDIVREPIVLMGASRTDAGVHARGQVAAFTCSPIDPPDSGPGGSGPEGASSGGWPLSRGVDRLVRAINGRLPDDALVLAAEPAPADFDPIRDAAEKQYTYTLHVSPPPPHGKGLRPLFDRRYVHHAWEDLDVGAMNAAAAPLVGEHDFAAFTAINHGRLTTVRTVTLCRAEELAPVPEGRRIRVTVQGSGFLYNMVRIIAGTLVEAGRGRMTPGAVAAALASRDRRSAGPTLPPTGLCLEWIRYPA